MFPKEIANIQSHCNRSELVRPHRQFLDKDNLLRCGGSIHKAPPSELGKFSFLLPSSNISFLLPSHYYLTVIVIQNAHATQLHSGVNATLIALHERYWIPSAHQRIESIIGTSVVCRKTSGKLYTVSDSLH